MVASNAIAMSSVDVDVVPFVGRDVSRGRAKPTVRRKVSEQEAQKQRMVERVSEQSDDLVLVIDYLGKDGNMTRRVVSPIRMVGEGRFLALCLCREEPRQFYLDRCHDMRIDLASEYVMPVEMQVFERFDGQIVHCQGADFISVQKQA